MKMIKKISSLVLVLFVSLFCLVGCNNYAVSIKQSDSDSDDGGDSQIQEQIDSPNNFASLSTTSFENINGKTVKVDTFGRYNGETINNPNFGIAVLLAQCIDYKKKYPDQNVRIALTSFHLSVYAAACLNRESDNWGKMRNLYDAEEENGFVRISYLLVTAAKLGIKVLIIGQLDAAGVDGRSDMNFVEYFNSHADDKTFNNEPITDYLSYYRVGWTSYGDKAATDMMHLKTCVVSNYIDCKGTEHDGGLWVGSTNLDGVSQAGVNGNDGAQTGILVSNHPKLVAVMFNFVDLMEGYVGQEDITEFRNIVSARNKEQIDLINQGKESLIAADRQIVYLGSDTDQVFELYLTPFGSSVGSWNTTYNTFSKYIDYLSKSEGNERIALIWNNANFKQNFNFSETALNLIKNAFCENGNLSNALYMHCNNFNENGFFDELEEKINIGVKSINTDMWWWTHAKDLQVSYLKNGKRQYATIFNSLNFHEGALYYQVNSLLVVKETVKTKNQVFTETMKFLTHGNISYF